MARAIRMKPQLARAHYVMGLLRYKAGKVDEAIAELKLAADEDKTSTDVLENLANIYEQTQAPAKALDVYKELLVRDPKNALAKQKLATAKGGK